jgi:hypothetical protein
MNKITTNRLILGTIFFSLIFNFKYSHVKAQNELSDSIVNERILILKETLNRDKINTQRWWYGWLIAYSAATIGQGVAYFKSDDKNTRQDMALGAATTLLGAAGQFISPLIPGNEPEKLMTLPENTNDERLKKMIFAEKLLNEVAKREKLARSWKNHALTGAVNLSAGLITWLGFKRTVWAGIGNFALNTVITEAQIWTQPTLAKRKYANYYRNYILSDKNSTSVSRIDYYIVAHTGGFGIKIVF